MALEDDSGARSGRHFPFVGRERELSLLLAAVRHPPALILVEGEGGIGKSRLVAEAGADLAQEGRAVLTGYCQPLREPLPYGPVVDALRKTGPWLPPSGISPAAGALAPLLPDLADRLPAPPPRGADPLAERQRIVQAVRSVIESIGPVVLVIEDLHWVDTATRELLQLLIRDLPPELSLLLTYRPEDLPPRTPVLGSAYRRLLPGGSGTTIRLNRLEEQHIQQLAVSALGKHATRHLESVLFTRSEGLPLVIEEDLITLSEQGRRQSLRDARELEKSEVPAGLREAVTERLEHLSPAATAVVDAAAVLAVPATEELLAELAGLEAAEGAEALTEALHASVLSEHGPGLYDFRHNLAQQVAYQHIPGPGRRRLHRRAIVALEALSPAPLVQIAHHTRAAGDREAWFGRAEAAVDHATELGDTGTAGDLLRQILAESQLPGDMRSRATLALAQIAVDGVDYTANAQILRRLLADPELPADTRGEIRLGLGILLINHAEDRAGFAELEQSVAELDGRPERQARAMIAMVVNDWDDQRTRWAERAEELVRDSPDEAAKAAVRATRITALAFAGDPGVWEPLDRLPRHGEDLEVLRQTTRALYNAADCGIGLGHDRRAHELLVETREVAKRSGSLHLEAHCQVEFLRLEFHAGRWTGLEDRFAALSAAYPDVTFVGSEQNYCLAALDLAHGRRAAALERYRNAASDGERSPDVSRALRAAAGTVAVHLAQDASREAWAAATPAITLLEQTGVWVRALGLVPVAVQAALAAGERHAAEAIVRTALRATKDLDAPGAFAELALAQGLLLRESDPPEAAAFFADAHRRWQEIGRPYESAQAAEHLGRTLAATDRTHAVEQLTNAFDTYTRLGAPADAARCRHDLESRGLTRPPRRGRRGYGDQLSPREREVADLLARGATNQEIAQALFLSPRTVEQHVARALKKLNATRRTLRDHIPSGSEQGDAPS
ncbi:MULTISPECIES: ATP-binding protein [Streptomyces]|uniref:ATP-binding protein n=1 Tax=Streptomyces TaxID=1883 RepID=UPI00067AC9E4|nr:MULTISPECIES: AAA family ATPase [Streptomyces]MYW79241.1 AAA family ATPase [Streptomyces sp. SID8369]QRV59497.1 AAA family ATPase [Streptomyces californicus]SDE30229.1 regulatory protein, luxR family [Streptomyces sp. LaPpAH-199]